MACLWSEADELRVHASIVQHRHVNREKSIMSRANKTPMKYSFFLSKSCQENKKQADAPELTGVLQRSEKLLKPTEELKLVNSAWDIFEHHEVRMCGVFQLILYLKCFISSN